ncbi:MAG: phage terminase large subunit family protein [Armatimonadota bacterium]
MWQYEPQKVLELASAEWQWHPHLAQREWLLNTSPIKLAACGRRWGKTEALAVETAALLLLLPQSRHIVVAPTQDQANLMFERTWELLAPLAADRGIKLKQSPTPRISTQGGWFVSRSAHRDGRNLRGRSADRVVVDEAAYVSEALITGALMPILADRQGQLVLLSTPNGRNHFYQWYLAGQRGEHNISSFSFPTSSNPAIDASFLAMQRLFLPERQYLVEYEAQFADAAGAVFTEQMISDALVPIELDLRHGIQRVAGVDFALSRDYTAWVCLETASGKARMVEALRLPRLHYRAQADRLAEMAFQSGVQCIACDATGVGVAVVELLEGALRERRLRIRVIPETFTERRKLQLVDGLILALERDQLQLLPLPNLLDELRAFHLQAASLGHTRMQAVGTEHDDLVMALALACSVAPFGGGVSRSVLLGGDRASLFRG